MLKRILLLPLLLVTALGFTHEENWIEISTQHFTVYCNDSEKRGRQVAEQLERMRAVFQTAYPDMSVDPSAPIVVIAAKDEKSFRALEPEDYLAKGQAQITGFFLRALDKNYILLRMDVTSEQHPYAAVYHEYTHLLFGKKVWLPLWLNEGLAEFYENTDIRDKDTIIGEPSKINEMLLRQNPLLPLSTLLTVDYKSPYYHQEQEASIFYAESWALTHYLKVSDARNGTHHVYDYMVLVSNHVDPVTAATQAFGGLKQLEIALGSYTRQFSLYGKMTKALPVDDTTFKVQPVSGTQADAVRADLLAYNGREKDARALLDQVLHDDPKNTLAHETMGFLESQAGNLEKAQEWYAQAVKLDSQSYLACYRFAAIALNRGQSGEEMNAEIVASLRKAIKLNPEFSLPYDALGSFYGARRENLDEAHMLMLQAVSLDPENVQFRIHTAEVLLEMEREADAITVLNAAMKLAKTPEETAQVENELGVAQQIATARQKNEEFARQAEKADSSADAATDTDDDPKKVVLVMGPRKSITGTINNVHCTDPAVLDMDVNAGGKTITAHSNNYFKIEFTSLGVKPKPNFQPCADLEGKHAKVDYIDSAATKTNGLVAIELHQ